MVILLFLFNTITSLDKHPFTLTARELGWILHTCITANFIESIIRYLYNVCKGYSVLTYLGFVTYIFLSLCISGTVRAAGKYYWIMFTKVTRKNFGNTTTVCDKSYCPWIFFPGKTFQFRKFLSAGATKFIKLTSL